MDITCGYYCFQMEVYIMSSSSYDLPKGMDPALAAENPYKVFVKIEDHCAQRSGGARLRYTIRVNGRTSYLYQQLVLSD